VSRLTGTGSVSFDMSPLIGDPDVSPSIAAAGVVSASTPTSDSLELSEPEVSQGLWSLVAGEVGPYPAGGAAKEIVTANVSAVAPAFDPAMHSSTDDLWQVGTKFSKFYYLEPGQSVAMQVTITPTAAVGTKVLGTLYIDDFTLESFVGIREVLPDADEVAALPYSYTVAAS
jgi:hypothetical protein